MNIYLIMAFGGLLGILLHTLKACRDISKRHEALNFKMVVKEYWKHEGWSLFGSVLCFAVLLFVASEFVNLQAVDNPDYATSIKDRLLNFKISNFIKLSSVIAGYFSDSLVYSFLGTTEKKMKEKFLSEQHDLETKN